MFMIGIAIHVKLLSKNNLSDFFQLNTPSNNATNVAIALVNMG